MSQDPNIRPRSFGLSENNKSVHQTSWNSVPWVAYYICYAVMSTGETTILHGFEKQKAQDECRSL